MNYGRISGLREAVLRLLPYGSGVIQIGIKIGAIIMERFSV